MQAQIADEVWEYSDITKYSVDTERGIFKIADSKYSYDADLFVESNGEKIRLSDLNEKMRSVSLESEQKYYPYPSLPDRELWS